MSAERLYPLGTYLNFYFDPVTGETRCMYLRGTTKDAAWERWAVTSGEYWKDESTTRKIPVFAVRLKSYKNKP